MLCLGIDSGTKSTKALVLDLESRKIVAFAQKSYETIAGLPHGHVEQAPQTWIDAADATIRECIARIDKRKVDIVAIGVAAQQHGLVALDAKNEPIRPAKLWCDISTAAQSEKLNKAFGSADELIERTGNAMFPGYTASKLLWLKENEPQNFRRIRSILLPHDYINFWLTGEKRMEHGDASGTGLMDVRARKWYAPLMDFIDKNLAAKFPPLRSSTRPVGLLRNVHREGWGLGHDVLVSAGGGDNMLGALGTGNIKPNMVTVSLGNFRNGVWVHTKTNCRSKRRDGDFLRQHRTLAPARVHDECRLRERATHEVVSVGRGKVGRKSCSRSNGCAGFALSPIFAR